MPAGTTLRDAVRFIGLKGIRRVLVYDASKEDPLNPLAAYTVRGSAHSPTRFLPRRDTPCPSASPGKDLLPPSTSPPPTSLSPTA